MTHKAHSLAAAGVLASSLFVTTAQAEADVLPAYGTNSAALLSAQQPFSLSVPSYSSLPTAAAKIYLDFDGDVTQTWGTYSPGTTPAYSIDTDTNNFSSVEVNNIREIWMRVAEEFSPFNIDVTTVDPGNLTDNQTLRIVIGGDGKNGQADYWVGSRAGGIGYVGGYYNTQPNTVYVFPGNLANGTPKYTAMAAAHEAGHGFGLQHQSAFDASGNLTSEYNPGDSLRAPIMGRSYDAQRGVWWSGPSGYSTNIQSDLSYLNSQDNDFYYRVDDFGNTVATAWPVNTGSTTAIAGVIARMTDRDVFRITMAQDFDLLAVVNVAEFGAMLDANLGLLASDGSLIQLVSTSSLGETLSAHLLAGTYGVFVESAGQYGDIGQYVLNITVPEPSALLAMTGLLTLLKRRR